MSALERIVLKGFKSIREMDLELRPLNILIGANGSGKSNLLSLLAMINQMVRKHLQEYVGTSGGADALLHFGRKNTEFIRCELLFPHGVWALTLRAGVRDTLIVVDERWEFPDVPSEYTTSGYSEEASFPQVEDSYPDSVASEALRRLWEWRVYHFHDTSKSAKVKMTCDLHDNEYLRSDGANLASVLYLLQEKQRDHYRNVVDTVRMAAPFFDDFRLRPSPLNENKIRLEWRERGTDMHFGPEALSDGSLRFICLATLLMQPELPPLIIVDEPELGLHPAALGLVAAMLRSAAARTQVIVCTQSVTLVNQFAPEDIVVLDRENGTTTFKRLAREEFSDWLEEYSIGELWEKNVIGGRP